MANKFKAEIESDLGPLLRQLDATAARPRKLLTSAGNAMVELVKIGFRTSKDPYGSPWRQSKTPGETLRDRGILINSYVMRVAADQVEVGTPVCYAPVHQHGATIHASGSDLGRGPGHESLCGHVTTGAQYLRFRMGGQWYRKQSVQIPQRMMVPTASRGWPEAWRKRVVRAMHGRWKAELRTVA